MQHIDKVLTLYNQALEIEYRNLARKNSALRLFSTHANISLDEVFVERKIRKIPTRILRDGYLDNPSKDKSTSVSQNEQPVSKIISEEKVLLDDALNNRHVPK
jgi:hypothetical protein